MKTDKAQMFLSYWQMLGNSDDADLLTEYPFDQHIGRRHRFDFAFTRRKLAIEVDGGQHLRGGGRHNTDTDRQKLNIAAMLGWRVMRFSPEMLTNDPAACIEMVVKALEER